MRACPACLSVFSSEPEFCIFDGQRLGTPDEALVGRTMGGYRFTGLVGVGGTGCVFSGVDEVTGQPCAIKLLYGEMASDRGISERFRREAEAVRLIDHPNVVKVLDTGHSPAGLTYLVMELIDGPTLKTIIDDEAPLSPQRTGRIAEQLVAGLAEAHHQGFIHRDLKPGNIIVTRGRLGEEHVKILDFGIVANLHAPPDGSRLTKTGYIVGTPTYMAPEQVDPRAVSPQADVYALGVILYELLAGEPPFNGSLEQILVAKMTEKPPPIPHAGELGRLVLSLLESKPSHRPANALHVSAELNRLTLLDDDPITVRADVNEASLRDGVADSGVRLFDRTEGTPVADRRVEDDWVADTGRTSAPLEADIAEAMQTDAMSPLDPTIDPDVFSAVPADGAARTIPTDILARGRAPSPVVQLADRGLAESQVTAATMFTPQRPDAELDDRTAADDVVTSSEPPARPLPAVRDVSVLTTVDEESHRATSGARFSPPSSVEDALLAVLDADTEERDPDAEETAFDVSVADVRASRAPAPPPTPATPTPAPAMPASAPAAAAPRPPAAARGRAAAGPRPLAGAPRPAAAAVPWPTGPIHSLSVTVAPPSRPPWVMSTAVILLLTLSALLGFYLASQRETVLVDVPPSPTEPGR